MTQRTALSRGSLKNQQFIQDTAGNYIVEAFVDVSLVAPGNGLPAAVDAQQYLIESGSSSILPAWGTITGVQDKAVIRYDAVTAKWKVVFTPALSTEGAKVYDKDSDTLYTFDGGDWNVASGTGGGVKNFAENLSTAYKVGSFVTGNSTLAFDSGVMNGLLSIETVLPLDGKKSYKYTTELSSENDWWYWQVPISEYARGGLVAFKFDYRWNGEVSLNMKVFSDGGNERTTELNTLPNTLNIDKKSRSAIVVFPVTDTETYVRVGFQVPAGTTPGKEFVWDNVKVTDDMAVVSAYFDVESQQLDVRQAQNGILDGSGEIRLNLASGLITNNQGPDLITLQDDATNTRTKFYANKDCDVEVVFQCRLNTVGHNAQVFYNGRVFHGATVRTGTDLAEVVAVFKMNAGSFFTVSTGGIDVTSGTLTSTGTPLVVAVKSTPRTQTSRFLVLPNGEKLKDYDFLKVSNIGTINYQSGNIVTSVTWVSPHYRITYKAGLTSIPSVVATVADKNFNYTLSTYVENESVTGCEITIKERRSDNLVFSNGTNNYPFNLVVGLTGSDVAPDIVTVPVAIQGGTHEADSYVEVRNAVAGGGGVNPVQWDSVFGSKGSAIIYNATDKRMEIQSSGLYNIDVNFALAGVGSTSIRVNSSEIALFKVQHAGDETMMSRSIYLNKGDFVDVFSNQSIASNSSWKFSVTKIGVQPILDGGLVETPGSILRLEGTTGFNTAGFVRRLTNAVETSLLASGDVSYIDNATDGTVVTIEKDGFYILTACDLDGSPNIYEFGITKNASSLSSLFTIAASGKILATGSASSTVDLNGCSTGVPLNKGDTIRLHSQAPSASTTEPYRTFLSIARVGQSVRYSSRVYKEEPIAFQTKFLSSNVGSDGVIPSLSFSNLEIGKVYRVSGLIESTCLGGTGATGLHILNGSNFITGHYHLPDSFTVGTIFRGPIASKPFIATATSLTAQGSFSGGSYITGSPLGDKTQLTLEELPFHAATTKWT